MVDLITKQSQIISGLLETSSAMVDVLKKENIYMSTPRLFDKITETHELYQETKVLQGKIKMELKEGMETIDE